MDNWRPMGVDLVYPEWGGTEINFNLNPIGIKKNYTFGMFANTLAIVMMLVI
ncbi:MAG: hypothetical protein IPL95_05375 [Saprospiraceae bacterium]|nr:hypothetical protein [Saprospiraceae bacterium]